MAAHGPPTGQQPSDAGSGGWRDTTALPAGATREQFDACAPVTRDGYPGIDPAEAATERALEEHHFDLGVDPDR